MAEAEDPAAGLPSRVAAALVLAPVAAAAVLAGPWWFAALVAAAGAAAGREWGQLTRLDAAAVLPVMLAVPAAAAAGLAWGVGSALLAVAVLALAAGGRGLAGGGTVALWSAAGVVALGVPAASLAWLRGTAGPGAATVLWLLAVVWATDVAAFFVGRTIGGRLLVPRYSPRKTWSGLAGGAAGAGLAGAAAGAAAGFGPILPLAALGVVLALVAQGGDVLESALKRRSGVKDSGTLIPGHGGVLDRIDGLLTAAPALAVVLWLSGGRMPA